MEATAELRRSGGCSTYKLRRREPPLPDGTQPGKRRRDGHDKQQPADQLRMQLGAFVSVRRTSIDPRPAPQAGQTGSELCGAGRDARGPAWGSYEAGW